MCENGNEAQFCVPGDMDKYDELAAGYLNKMEYCCVDSRGNPYLGSKIFKSDVRILANHVRILCEGRVVKVKPKVVKVKPKVAKKSFLSVGSKVHPKYGVKPSSKIVLNGKYVLLSKSFDSPGVSCFFYFREKNSDNIVLNLMSDFTDRTEVIELLKKEDYDRCLDEVELHVDKFVSEQDKKGSKTEKDLVNRWNKFCKDRAVDELPKIHKKDFLEVLSIVFDENMEHGFKEISKSINDFGNFDLDHMSDSDIVKTVRMSAKHSNSMRNAFDFLEKNRDKIELCGVNNVAGLMHDSVVISSVLSD